jgi:hypothetical protein
MSTTLSQIHPNMIPTSSTCHFSLSRISSLTYKGKRVEKAGKRCILCHGHDPRAIGAALMALNLTPAAETLHELGSSQAALQYLMGV